MEVIGVVGDVRDFSLTRKPVTEIYTCYQQGALSFNPLPHMKLVFLLSEPDRGFAGMLLDRVHSISPGLPAPDIIPMDALYAAAIASRRFIMFLVIVFAVTGLVLATVGIYGVTTYLVTRRTREIGLRIALGAGQLHILRLVMKRILVLVMTGLAIGIGASMGFTQWLRSFLYQVGPLDPLTFAAVGLLLVVVALCAAYLPARRATRIDPLAAIRFE